MKSPNTTVRLGRYLSATVTIGTLASSAGAAVVNLNVSSISGLNGGLAPGNTSSISLSSLGASLNGTINIWNDKGAFSRFTGLVGSDGLQFAIDGNYPRNFASGSVIDGGQSYSSYIGVNMFLNIKYNGDILRESPDFGSGSHMGFRVDGGNGNYNYGWLEVTWDSADDEFYIISGAVNTTLNASITAGTGVISAIPEPGSAFGTLGILAAGMMIRRRGKKAA